MNALVPTYHANLPDFLRDPNLFGLSDQVSAGIGGGQPPYISIKASKFRLVDGRGEEELVNQLHLDVLVVGSNRWVSKTYYREKFNPNAESAVPPTCFSDNGVAPSSRASEPQHVNCAGCHWNAWGSAVSEASGKPIRACQDAKKLAVVLAADTPTLKGHLGGAAKAGAQLYQLRLPAMSMRGLADWAKKIKETGNPLAAVVLRLGFDPNASYPLITFTPVRILGNADEAFFASIRSLFDQIPSVVGADDEPFVAGEALPVVPASAPQPTAGPVFPPASPAAAPAFSAPATPATPTPSAASATPTRKRGRPAGVPPANGTSSPEPLAAAGPTLGPFDDRPGQPPIQPAAATSPQMDALLDGIFAKTAG